VIPFEGQPEGFSAELMDGASAEVKAVAVALAGDRLQLRSADRAFLEEWPLAGLGVDPLVEGVLHLTHGDHPGALLSSSDAELRAVLLAAGVAPRRREARATIAHAAFYAATIACAVALFVAGLPALSAAIARRVPTAMEEQIALPMHALFEGRYCRSGGSHRALSTLVERLRLPGDPFYPHARTEIVDLPVVNAFTFPGGSVVVTRALVDEAQTPEELAGVVAHEMEHAARRHVLAQVVRSAILTTGWQLTVGDFSGLMAIDPATTMQIASRSFSRDAEREADQGALRRLRNAGFSSSGLASFFERIEDRTDKVPEWLSTHPTSAARRKSLSGSDGGKDVAALSIREWDSIKQACRNRPR
jgi:Zn-dependent protease with chaperone function